MSLGFNYRALRFGGWGCWALRGSAVNSTALQKRRFEGIGFAQGLRV